MLSLGHLDHLDHFDHLIISSFGCEFQNKTNKVIILLFFEGHDSLDF